MTRRPPVLVTFLLLTRAEAEGIQREFLLPEVFPVSWELTVPVWDSVRQHHLCCRNLLSFSYSPKHSQLSQCLSLSLTQQRHSSHNTTSLTNNSLASIMWNVVFQLLLFYLNSHMYVYKYHYTINMVFHTKYFGGKFLYLERNYQQWLHWDVKPGSNVLILTKSSIHQLKLDKNWRKSHQFR